MVDAQKRKVKKINRFVWLLSFAVSVYIAALLIIAITIDKGLVYTLLYEILIIFINFVLIHSVSSIRNTIKAIEDKFPNDKLMCVHLVNFIVYTLIFLVTSTMKTICSIETSNNGTSYDLKSCEYDYYISAIQNLFYNYMTLFLMYLIIRFSRERLNESKKDPCLGKKVPIIVYIQNQKMIKQVV